MRHQGLAVIATRNARRAAVAELLWENRYRLARVEPHQTKHDIEPMLLNFAAEIVERIDTVDRWLGLPPAPPLPTTPDPGVPERAGVPPPPPPNHPYTNRDKLLPTRPSPSPQPRRKWWRLWTS